MLPAMAERWAVVGAGLTGLVAALRLSQAGRRVTVYERYPAPGGLVATFEVGGERLECFYHHVFTSDRELLALAAELGLAGEIEWLPSRMGLFTAGRMWDFGTPASLLRFHPLPLADKVRFALATLRLRQARRPEPFEAVTAIAWLERHSGKRATEVVWRPLLAQKFAGKADTVSMAWLWHKIHVRGRSRGRGGLDERLGLMRGSFGRLVEALAARVVAAGGELRLAEPVRRIAPASAGVRVTTNRGEGVFDAALFTAAPSELGRVLGEGSDADTRERLAGIDHTAAVCAVLELDRPLSPYYWLSIADAGMPFGGVIEHTNIVPAARYGGCHVVYLSKYVFESHPLWSASAEAVWRVFAPHLCRINPAFSQSWVLDRHCFKAANAQPVVTCAYTQRRPAFATPVPGLFHACMAQIYPEDRGQNYAIRLGADAARRVMEETR